MKIFHIILVITILMYILTINVNANLIDRGNGLIYDDDLNITWLQDANYANTTMTWLVATEWAENLIFQGFDDWRLPVSDGSCTGNGCTGSEMGYLFYSEGITSDTSGPFQNIKPSMYWSASEFEIDPLQAWRFNFKYGTQGTSEKETTRYAWAVRTGDVPLPVAPEPISSLLFITGGTVLAIKKYNCRKRIVNL